MHEPCPNDFKTSNNHRQTDKQIKIINRVKREQLSLRRKLLISFNRVNINAIDQSKQELLCSKKFWMRTF